MYARALAYAPKAGRGQKREQEAPELPAAVARLCLSTLQLLCTGDQTWKEADRHTPRLLSMQGVAVLFLLDTDVYLFEFWIPEQARARMEEFGAPVVR